MELKEKILALGIALVFYLLASNITGLILPTYRHGTYDGDCYAKYPFPSYSETHEDPLQAERDACLQEWNTKTEFNYLLGSIAMMAIALAALAVGYFLIKLESIESISTGIMGGGILALLHSAVLYYTISKAQLEKTLLLLVAFIILLTIGYFKFAKKPKK